MKGWRRHVAAALCTAWRLGRPWRGSPSCRMLMYHAIGTPIADDALGRYTLSPTSFAAQVQLLADNVAATPVIDIAAYEQRPGSYAITFDDGYRDNLTVAAPILVRHGLPFTVFITRDYMRSGGPVYLSAAEVRELATLPGVTIGCHGASHQLLTTCSDVALDDELAGSRAYLEDLIQRPVHALSYPHGIVDERVRAAAAKAGFRIGATSRFGAVGQDTDPLALNRTDIWSTDTLDIFSQKLAGDWDWLKWRK